MLKFLPIGIMIIIVDIMVKTNALYKNNDENKTNPTASKSWK